MLGWSYEQRTILCIYTEETETELGLLNLEFYTGTIY